jgi:hypothetical protein
MYGPLLFVTCNRYGEFPLCQEEELAGAAPD